MALIDKETIRKKIEFAKSVYSNPKRVVHGVADAFRQDGRAAMCDDILKFLDTLPEQPMKLKNSQRNKNMTREEIINALQSDKTMPFIQPDQLANIVDFVSENYKPFFPENLEEAAKNRVTENGRFPISEFEELRIRDIKFGAEWQKKQDQETIELAEDHAMLAGMNKMEQQMIEKAYDTIMQFNELNDLVPTFEDMQKFGFKVGDKVKVIILKEK